MYIYEYEKGLFVCFFLFELQVQTAKGTSTNFGINLPLGPAVNEKLLLGRWVSRKGIF